MRLPHESYHQIQLPRPDHLHSGLDGVVHGLTGHFHRRRVLLSRLQRDAEQIERSGSDIRALDDGALQEQLQQIGLRFVSNPEHKQNIIEAFPFLVEAAERIMGLRPYREQIMGALALCQGNLVEMGTGEGKSLTAMLAAVIFAWSRRPFHLLTVNDYLSRRDAEAFQPFYRFCGVSVSVVTEDMDDQQRQESYKAGIVYTTGKQMLADFLRDRLKLGTVQHPSRRLLREDAKKEDNALQQMVMRGLDAVIVDEADSILIDEAVSPLIISSPGKNDLLLEAVSKANQLVGPFEEESDFKVDQRHRNITFTKAGKEKLIGVTSHLPGIWQAENRREELIKQALMARTFYHKDQHYIIHEGKILIVDEFSGRLMPNRSWGQGLHQAIEAKEGVEMTPPSETIARLSFQRFFRLFRRMSGMTGTGLEAAKEFWKIYQLPTLPIPPHQPSQQAVYPNIFCQTRERKWDEILESVINLNQQGRPVLIGTRSVQDSERLAIQFRRRGLRYKLLNAVVHEKEAEIIAEAGVRGSITISTNMAGRGTDIKLGDGVAELGGLHVIISERHESARIDRQLAGRAARQGDPGSVQTFLSQDDEIMIQNVRTMDRFLPLILRMNSAQKRAERSAFKQRKMILRADQWMDESLLFGQRIVQV
jgi:preprotein translocase subunit SecA